MQLIHLLVCSDHLFKVRTELNAAIDSVRADQNENFARLDATLATIAKTVQAPTLNQG